MTEDTLVWMANQIADFFKALPEEEALAGTSNHIRLFWDPRMRSKVAAHLKAGGAGLNPLARKAAEKVCQPAKTA